jgi:hypothetical protein
MLAICNECSIFAKAYPHVNIQGLHVELTAPPGVSFSGTMSMIVVDLSFIGNSVQDRLSRP